MSEKLNQIIEKDKNFLFQNYGDRLPVSFIRGEDSYLFDQDENRYIDFLSGIAVNNLGYSNERLKNILHEKIDSLVHTSNWFYNSEQAEAAELISNLSFPGKTLFVNTGTEANEAALKLARRYGQSISVDKFRVVSFSGSFHGRTFGSLSATAQEKIRTGLGPILGGFTYIPFNDYNALNGEISKGDVCAVILELIQGEGGINLIDDDFLKKMEALCKENNVLIIIDEIQTGVGRTGKPFGFQNFPVNPDIITLAKGLGSGIPIGAIHTRDNLLDFFPAGSHGTTFGGNHLACAAASVVLKEISTDDFLNHVNEMGDFIKGEMLKLKDKFNFIKDIRGKGLHIGIELTIPGMDIVKKALDRKLVINCTAGNVIRIMPPLNISKKIIVEGLTILESVLSEELK